MQEPYRLTASQALQLIQANKLTVEAYAQSLLSRIESRDATVHAWAYLNRELVLEQARQLDKIPIEKRGPLHGIPIGIKDVIYTKDMPTQHNSPLFKDSHVSVDAASVAILRAAGALIFGKTTTTEFAATTIGSPTINPHSSPPSTPRTPGGSSSGSGAAVADYQVPLALGTQTGGSIIRPGSFNGVYAMKPTWGAISREGQKVYSLILDTVGFYARSVEDLGVLGGVLGLKDDDDDDGGVSDRKEAGVEGVAGLKFGIVKTCVWPRAEEGTVSAMQKAEEILKRHGAIVEEVDLPDEFDNMPDWHAKIMAAAGRTTFLAEYRIDKSQIHESLVGHVENVNGATRAEQLAAFDGIAILRPRIDEIAGRYAALVTPSIPGEAPLGIEGTGSAAFNSMWTALHTPVVNIPGFQGENGMPVGVSLVAPRFRDQHLLSVAKEVGDIFEKEGGWTSAL
ncbi:amidase signature domain-containing protein [Aspergillus cavernicola]|uniref:Amidase signature domain-containing protein n=1 Tax=Aspergillus cavernicola TaxID=176166 RepID=A0ABR4J1E4_9EURO